MFIYNKFCCEDAGKNSKVRLQCLALEYRGVEQLVARRAHNPKVVGSSPAPATIDEKQFNES